MFDSSNLACVPAMLPIAATPADLQAVQELEIFKATAASSAEPIGMLKCSVPFSTLVMLSSAATPADMQAAQESAITKGTAAPSAEPKGTQDAHHAALVGIAPGSDLASAQSLSPRRGHLAGQTTVTEQALASGFASAISHTPRSSSARAQAAPAITGPADAAQTMDRGSALPGGVASAAACSETFASPSQAEASEPVVPVLAPTAGPESPAAAEQFRLAALAADSGLLLADPKPAPEVTDKSAASDSVGCAVGALAESKANPGAGVSAASRGRDSTAPGTNSTAAVRMDHAPTASAGAASAGLPASDPGAAAAPGSAAVPRLTASAHRPAEVPAVAPAAAQGSVDAVGPACVGTQASAADPTADAEASSAPIEAGSSATAASGDAATASAPVQPGNKVWKEDQLVDVRMKALRVWWPARVCCIPA